jgi:hypothetical protein
MNRTIAPISRIITTPLSREFRIDVPRTANGDRCRILIGEEGILDLINLLQVVLGNCQNTAH